jgi:formylglycine-generating enzyme required for sulfatase activity
MPTHVPEPMDKPAGVPGSMHLLEPIDTRVCIRYGMALVRVPEGQFEMVSDQGERTRPVHTVAVDAFWIDQTEVTNAMFSLFVNERGNQVEEGVRWLEPGAGHRGIICGHIDETDGIFLSQAGYEEYPVAEVSWCGAAAYCSWAGARLPTDAECDSAARGPQSLRYPWVDIFDGSRANYCDVNCTYHSFLRGFRTRMRVVRLGSFCRLCPVL